MLLLLLSSLSSSGLVKPDIVFFGEGLPERFFEVSDAGTARTARTAASGVAAGTARYSCMCSLAAAVNAVETMCGLFPLLLLLVQLAGIQTALA